MILISRWNSSISYSWCKLVAVFDDDEKKSEFKPVVKLIFSKAVFEGLCLCNGNDLNWVLVANVIANVIKMSIKYAIFVVFNDILRDINDIIEQLFHKPDGLLVTACQRCTGTLLYRDPLVLPLVVTTGGQHWKLVHTYSFKDPFLLMTMSAKTRDLFKLVHLRNPHPNGADIWWLL